MSEPRQDPSAPARPKARPRVFSPWELALGAAALYWLDKTLDPRSPQKAAPGAPPPPPPPPPRQEPPPRQPPPPPPQEPAKPPWCSPLEVLGLEGEATEDQIRSAYRRRSRATHPDHGGDPDRFALAAKAYDYLIQCAKQRQKDTR